MNPQEIRDRILSVVQKNGGHLASSLGAVEIAIALREIFDPNKDRIVWDVGHQAYAWKLLTNRDKSFDTLRQLDGMAPFPLPSESCADAAVAGHAGVAISVAAGYAAARDLRSSDEHVVAVVGDSAIANGTSFEAMNNLSAATKKLIVILNDNEMSISRPTGSFAKVLGKLITNVSYNRAKSAAESAGHKLHLSFLSGIYHRLESQVKSWFLGNAYFEQFGLRYIGPIDGHDLDKLKAAFLVAKEDKRSVLVHVVTKKGKGYAPAEADPTGFHGVSPASSHKAGITWSNKFGEIVTNLAATDNRIVALTAGMKCGTGLDGFAARFPLRFFDVGIAEGHLVSFAAGLAAGGMRPVVAVYSTFLQRAIDQIVHDVCIAKLPVIFCVDRAGVVGADGVTHQGVFDIAMLKSIPNLTICQPTNAADFELMMKDALLRNGPTVIRYPRGVVSAVECKGEEPIKTKFAIYAVGDQLDKAIEVSRRIGGAEVIPVRYIKPFDVSAVEQKRADGYEIVTIENGVIAGGFGESIGADFKFGWPDSFITHGKVSELEQRYGFDVESIVSTLIAKK